uniref:(northern house mosquito) hypothetical protein n=1 Tax=Culex pipiens TaxID=7175 RepID=A0A8D8D6G1_CULPI
MVHPGQGQGGSNVRAVRREAEAAGLPANGGTRYGSSGAAWRAGNFGHHREDEQRVGASQHQEQDPAAHYRARSRSRRTCVRAQPAAAGDALVADATCHWRGRRRRRTGWIRWWKGGWPSWRRICRIPRRSSAAGRLPTAAKLQSRQPGRRRRLPWRSWRRKPRSGRLVATAKRLQPELQQQQ